MKRKYNEHKRSAKQRGIPFLLTYDEWLAIWQASGHFDERGKRRGNYCMARFGDAGPYSVDNVRIITMVENAAERSRVAIEQVKLMARNIAKRRAAEREEQMLLPRYPKLSAAAKERHLQRRRAGLPTPNGRRYGSST
jgi:hypothetical protein